MSLPVNLAIQEDLIQKPYNEYFTTREQYFNDLSSPQHRLLIEQLIQELRLLNLNLNITNAAVNALAIEVNTHIIGPGHEV